MVIIYKEGLGIDSDKLDELWSAIGWKSRGSNKWKEVLSKSSYMYTAWDNRKLIGTGRIMEDGVMCMFYDIGVHPKYQRQGIGSKILQQLIKKVKDKKYVSIGLFSWEQNPANIPFYKKQGFVQKTSGMELDKYMTPE